MILQCTNVLCNAEFSRATCAFENVVSGGAHDEDYVVAANGKHQESTISNLQSQSKTTRAPQYSKTRNMLDKSWLKENSVHSHSGPASPAVVRMDNTKAHPLSTTKTI